MSIIQLPAPPNRQQGAGDFSNAGETFFAAIETQRQQRNTAWNQTNSARNGAQSSRTAAQGHRDNADTARAAAEDAQEAAEATVAPAQAQAGSASFAAVHAERSAIAQSVAHRPIGQAQLFPAALAAPAGWLPCDGRSLVRTSPVAADLFVETGTAFGFGADGDVALANRIPNGDFATNLSGWTLAPAGGWTWATGGKAQVANTATAAQMSVLETATAPTRAILVVDVDVLESPLDVTFGTLLAKITAPGVHRFAVRRAAGEPSQRLLVLSYFDGASGIAPPGNIRLNRVALEVGGTFNLPTRTAPAGYRYLIRATR